MNKKLFAELLGYKIHHQDQCDKLFKGGEFICKYKYFDPLSDKYYPKILEALTLYQKVKVQMIFKSTFNQLNIDIALAYNTHRKEVLEAVEPLLEP